MNLNSSIIISIIALSLMGAERARPPKKWDKATLSIFSDNAFSLLEGEKPIFAQKEKEKTEETVKKADGDFDRRDMMKKLERAEEILAESLNNQKTFISASSKINSAADLVIMMGKTLFNGDPDYGYDDSFLKFSEDMTTNAKLIKIFVTKKDYEGASKAFSNLKKNCNSCHEGFK
jgi:cytochrome c556